MSLLLLGCAPARTPQVLEFVVPPGTQARLTLGETVTIMPAEISLRVGDTLRIRNDDTSDQSVGPYFVAAGETVEITYGQPGRYEGYCPLSEGSTYVIEITR